MIPSFLLSLTAACVAVQATPSPLSSQGIVVPLSIKAEHATRLAEPVVDLDWLKASKAHVARKYGYNNLPLQKRGGAADNLTDEGSGSLWTGPITIGGQGFNIDWDTGSSDLWVSSSTCNSSECTDKNTYTPSSNATVLPGSFHISYQDTTFASGPIYLDTVTVANLTAGDQVFSAVTVSNVTGSRDGLSGLAFPSIAQLNGSGCPLFYTLIAQNQVTSPVFSIKLAENGSELYLGGINSALYTGSIVYTPVIVEEYWTVTLEGVTIDNVTIPISSNTSAIDSGTSLIVGPPIDVSLIWAQVPESASAVDTLGAKYEGFYIFPCASSPSISLSFGGSSFPIPQSTLNLGQISAESTMCLGGIQGEETVAGWIVGDVFLQGVYTIFDVGNSQVGFATLA